jgi:O-succinylbenzoic acid--CoA ligase
MMNILSPHFLIPKIEAKNKIHQIMDYLKTTKLTKDNPIGLYMDLSADAIFLLLASINLGLKVALCPVREPVLALNNWFKDLDINQVFSTSPHLLGINASWHDANSLGSAGQYSAKDCGNATTDFVSIIRTSGTMSEAKNAWLTHHQHVSSAISVNSYFNINEDSVWLLSLPLYHVSGLSIVYRSFLSGASIYLAKTYDEIVHGITQKMATHVSLIPMQLKRLLDDNIPMDHMKAIIIGADSLPIIQEKRALKLGLSLYATYGLTETASMVLVRDCKNNHETTLPHASIKISLDGEILVSGKSLFLGYLKEGILLKPYEDMFATGDILTNVGEKSRIVRKGNMIISSGFKISVEEVEAILEEHPFIEKTIVMGIDDERMGRRPLAFIKWYSRRLLKHELLDYLKDRLADYKIPVKFLPWPEDAPKSLKKPRQWFLEYLSQ